MLTQMMAVGSEWSTARIVRRALRFKAVGLAFVVGSGLIFVTILFDRLPNAVGQVEYLRGIVLYASIVVFICAVIVTMGTTSYIKDGCSRRTALCILENKLTPSKAQYLELLPDVCANCCSRSLEEVSYANVEEGGGFPTSYTTTLTCKSCGTERSQAYPCTGFSPSSSSLYVSSPYLTEEESQRFPNYSDCIDRQSRPVENARN